MAFPRRFLFISACKWDWKSFVGWHHVGAGGGLVPIMYLFVIWLALGETRKNESKV